MTGSIINECWEHGSDQKPPASVSSIIRDDEVLLWVARLGSGVHLRPLVWFGLGTLCISCLLLLLTQSQNLSEFCGPEQLRSCQKFYLYVSVSPVLLIPASLSIFWTAWKAKNKPWATAYVITTKRALIVDERKFAGTKSLDLVQHPVLPPSFGSVAFGKNSKKVMVFPRLERMAAERAYYWATVGRINHAAHLSTTP